jgi:hypothetical protein
MEIRGIVQERFSFTGRRKIYIVMSTILDLPKEIGALITFHSPDIQTFRNLISAHSFFVEKLLPEQKKSVERRFSKPILWCDSPNYILDEDQILDENQIFGLGSMWG